MFHKKHLEEYDETCNSVKDCAYLNRMCKALQFYQSYDESDHETLFKYFSAENYNLLLTDYHHILQQHLDNKPSIEIKKEFECIHNKIMQYIDHCSLHKCTKLKRNHRIREKQIINTKTNDDNTTAKMQFYMDTLDTIHCYFIHSYDIGFRLKTHEMNAIHSVHKNDEHKHNDTDTSYLYKDIQMKQLQNILHTKRKELSSIRGINRMQHNKFVTKMESETTDKTETKQCDDATYSFGQKYYYWEYYKNNNDTELNGSNEGYPYTYWFIQKKYARLKEELLCNDQLTLSPKQYENVMYRATQHIQSKHCRKNMNASGDLLDKYNIKIGANINLENIIVIILYCDYDELSFEFSKTFRKLNKAETDQDLKKRNSEYFHWSKIMRETVECYGTCVMDSKIDVYYHGVSYLLLNSFVSYFCGPTSTTPQICVATTFAKEDGLILELGIDDGRLTFFNCSWLSSYANEDERVFFGGFKPLRLCSVRWIKTHEDYRLFIKSFVLFNYVITKDYPLEEEKKLIDGTDYKIIQKLMINEKVNTFPKYVMDIWNSFCLNKKLIKIRLEYLHKYYKGFIPLLMNKKCSNLVKLYDLCVMFRNCSTIVIDFAAPWDVRDNNMDNVFISELFCYLDEINDANKKGLTKLKTIQFKYSKYNNLDPKQDFLDSFQRQFNVHQWYVEIGCKDLWIKKL